jgi:hypothetical protein
LHQSYLSRPLILQVLLVQHFLPHQMHRLRPLVQVFLRLNLQLLLHQLGQRVLLGRQHQVDLVVPQVLK